MLMEQTPNVTDVDDTLVALPVRQRFVVDRTNSASLRLDDQVDPVWITGLPREQSSRP
jgi:hypothetical protein